MMEHKKNLCNSRFTCKCDDDKECKDFDSVVPVSDKGTLSILIIVDITLPM